MLSCLIFLQHVLPHLSYLTSLLTSYVQPSVSRNSIQIQRIRIRILAKGTDFKEKRYRIDVYLCVLGSKVAGAVFLGRLRLPLLLLLLLLLYFKYFIFTEP